MSVTELYFVPLFMGPPEMLLLVGVLVLLVFGSKIPNIARSAGESFGQARNQKKQAEKELEGMEDEIEELREIRDQTIEDVTGKDKQQQQPTDVDSAVDESTSPTQTLNESSSGQAEEDGDGVDGGDLTGGETAGGSESVEKN